MMLMLYRGLLLALILSVGLVRSVFAEVAAPSQPAPAGVAVDLEGDVFVTDYAQDRVVKFSPEGVVVAQWGTSGNGPGQFSAPFGVALDERGVLFVVDQLNNRVQRFSGDGTPLGAWGSAGAGESGLRTPFGVAVSSGRIYVADFGNDRVQIYGSDGALLGSVGGRGTGEGQFLRPAGVAVDRDGSLYVSDHFNDRVQRFSPDGRYVSQVGTSQSMAAGAQAGAPSPAPLSRPEGIALDRDGNVWVADYGRDRIVKLAPDGRLLLSFGTRGSAAGEFVGPKGVAFDPTSGRLYVADTGNARVQRLTLDGTSDQVWPLP